MKYTVLVVDDENSIRALYREELEEEGYEVKCAQNRAEAFSALESGPVHVIILDIKLGKESGLQILQELSRHKSEIPVIISTAYSAYKDDYSSWLADGYVVKSSSLDELKIQVSKALGRHYGAGQSH